MADQVTNQIAFDLAVALVTIGVFSWFFREAGRRYAPPKRRVPARIYRLLEEARDPLFRGSRDVRLTVFVPDLEKKALVPFARIGWGQPSAESHIEFAPGEGLAGLALQRPDGILIARLGPFEDLERAREAHRVAFLLTRAQADALSEMQLKAAVLIASSLQKGRLLKGVLCIDSLDPALVPMDDSPEFWNALNRLTADLADALPLPVSAGVSRQPVVAKTGVVVTQIRLDSPLRPAQEAFELPAPIPEPARATA
jgi:hypothetical protein